MWPRAIPKKAGENRTAQGGHQMIYREYEIEAFEVGRSQWHARFRRTDRARARGFGPALTPSVKVSSLLLSPGGFFF